MTLACCKLDPHPQSPARQHTGPWLVWLHGLLGSGQDWLPVAELCGDYPSLLIDLPGHGNSVALTTTGFEDISRQISETLQANGIREYWLAGYSLGGRIAMYHACYGHKVGLQGLLVEGGNLGLESDELRKARFEQDCQWAQRFRHELCHRCWLTGISRMYLLIWIRSNGSNWSRCEPIIMARRWRICSKPPHLGISPGYYRLCNA